MTITAARLGRQSRMPQQQAISATPDTQAARIKAATGHTLGMPGMGTTPGSSGGCFGGC